MPLPCGLAGACTKRLLLPGVNGSETPSIYATEPWSGWVGENSKTEPDFALLRESLIDEEKHCKRPPIYPPVLALPLSSVPF